jgi:hypothetical protein
MLESYFQCVLIHQSRVNDGRHRRPSTRYNEVAQESSIEEG